MAGEAHRLGGARRISERLTVLPHVARGVSVKHHLRAIGVREVLRSGRWSKVTDLRDPQVAHPNPARTLHP